MSKTVDERVVQMRFDNSQFESGVKTSMSTLERLKQSLKLDNAAKGLRDVSAAASKVDLRGLSTGVETVQARFSALQVVGVTTLANITNAAVNAGKNLVKSFTVDPLINGFKEYELQMNSIQTILANTKSKGTTMSDVTAALDELNEYADLTIYNFAEMTKNIGTFTAAGVDLDTSVGAIKGIANLGAMSSSTSAQVNSAMYQLSQALATGRVSLMDWNSVVSAGMGGEQFQTALKRTAENFGYDVDAMIKKYGSFRESLTQGGWLTAEVLNETLNQIGGAYDEADLRAKGYSEEQIAAILDLAQTATEAATEVKTFTQLMDTLQEAVGSGFAKMWQNIFGDFEQAKEFFSGLHEMLEPIVTGPIDALNNVIEGAMDGGDISKRSGRELFLEGLTNALTAIIKPLQAVGAAFGEVFGINSDGLYNLIEGFNKFSEAIIISDDDAENLTKTFKGLFSIIRVITSAVGNALVFAFKAANAVLKPFGTSVLDISGHIGEAIYQFDQWVSSGNAFNDILNGMSSVLGFVVNPIRDFFGAFGDYPIVSNAISAVSDFFGIITNYISELTTFKPGVAIEKVFNDVKNAFVNLKNKLSNITWDDVINALTKFGEKVREKFEEVSEDAKELGPDILEGLQNGLKDGVEKVFEKISEIASNIIEAAKAVLGIHSPSTVFFDIGVNIIEGLCNGILYVSDKVTSTLSGVIQDVTDMLSGIDWGPIIGIGVGVGSFVVLYQLTDALQTFATGIKGFSAPFSAAGGVLTEVQTFMKGVNSEFFGTETSSKGLQNIAQSVKIFATAIAILAGSVAVLAQLDTADLWIAVGAIGALAAIVGGLAVALSKFADGGSSLDAIKLNTTLLSLAGSMLILSVAARIIGGMEWGDLGKAGAAIGVFAGIVAALMAVGTKAKNIYSVAGVLSKIGVAFLLLAATAKILGTMDGREFSVAAGMMAVFTGVVAALVAVTKYAGNDVDKTGQFMTKIGVAFLALAATSKILGTMSYEEMGKAATMLMAFGVVVAALIAVTEFGGKNIDKATSFIGKVGIAFLALAVAARLLGGMSFEDMGHAAVALAGLTAVVAALVAITNLAPKKKIAEVSAILISMSIAIGILAGIAILLSYVKTENLVKGLAAVSVLVVLMGLLTYATKFAGGTEHTQAAFIGMAVAIGVMAAAVAVLSFIEPSKLIPAVAAMSVLMALFALIAKAASGMKKVTASLAIMTVAIALMAGAILLISTIPAEQALSSAGALSAVMLSFATAMKIIGTVGRVSKSAMQAMGVMLIVVTGLAAILGVMSYLNVNASMSNVLGLAVLLNALATACVILGTVGRVSKSAITAMGVLTAVTAGLAVILGIMSALNVQASLPNVLALGVMLNAMASACLILGNVGRVSKSAMTAMGILTAVVAGLAIILGVMSALNVQASLPSAIALGTLLNAMAAACLILAQIKMVSPQALGAMGILTAVVAGLAIILGLMNGLGVEATIPTAVALSTLLIAMAGVTAILGLIGPAAAGAIAGAVALVGVVTVIGAFVAALGAISGQITELGTWLDQGGEILGKIGSAIGEFVGGFVGGALEGLSGSLPGIATNLSQFMMNLTPFIVGAKMIDPSVQQSITALANMILALTASSIIDGIASFLGGGVDFAGFAEQLVPFGQAMQQYSAVVSGIDAGAVQASAQAGQALAALANALPKEGGLAQAIFGENVDMGTFGTQLMQFGLALRMYGTAVAGLDIESIKLSAQAGQALSDLANSLPKEGGIAQAIFGETTDMGDFGTQLVQFGMGLKLYGDSVKGLDVESIQNSVTAGTALKDLANALPDSGGLKAWLFGDNDMGDFGSSLADFGGALKDYADSIAEVNFGNINTGTEAVRTLVNTIKAAFSDGDTIQTGVDNSWKITGVGAALKDYYDKISGVDVGQITTSTNALTQLKNFIESLSDFDGGGVDSFKSAVTSLGQTSFDGLVNSFNGAASQLTSIGTNLTTGLANGMKAGQGAVNSAANSITSSLVQAFTSKAPLFQSTGTQLITRLAAGMSAARTVAMTAAIGVGTSAASGLRSAYSSFYSSGLYVAQGFAAGIRSGAFAASIAAAAMANAAKAAAQRALDEHSPSKEFYKIGAFAGEGMVNALTDYQSASEKAGYAMGDSARVGLQNAISKVSSMVESDLNAQPTIRPVVDLSNVRSGANQIGSILGGTIPTDVLANARAISRSMNARNQNGPNDDVINAINKLRGDIGNINNTTYTVNGITYDDGSAIAGAVGDLIRASRIERRI